MNKAYNKITWQNKPSTATPLNQTNLNEMSNALDTIDDRVIALDSGKVGSVTVTNTLPTGDTIATITVDGTATNIKSAQVEVDSTPSATSENPLQNKAIYEMLNNLLPEETAEGNPIAISDASGLNAKACSVDLLPIQDLSQGEPSPTNICPISGRTELSLAVRGINQWDEQWEMGGYNQITGAKQSSTTTICNKNKIFVEGGVDYYFVIPNTGIRYFTYSKYGEYIATNLLISSGILRFGSDVAYINFQMNGTTYEDNISINYPSTDDTSYHAHEGETVIVQFGQTVYGGTLDVTNGKLTIDKAYVDLGNLTWTTQGNPNTFQAIITDFATPSNDLTCSAYPVTDYSISGGNMPDKSIKSYGNSSAKYIIVKDSSYSTTSEASTGLSGVQLCYPLVTPIEATLTAEQISLLKGNNVVFSDSNGNIKLTYSADIKAFIENQLSNS